MDLAFTAERWAGTFARNVPDALVLTVALAAALTLTVLAYLLAPPKAEQHTRRQCRETRKEQPDRAKS